MERPGNADRLGQISPAVPGDARWPVRFTVRVILANGSYYPIRTFVNGDLESVPSSEDEPN